MREFREAGRGEGRETDRVAQMDRQTDNWIERHIKTANDYISRRNTLTGARIKAYEQQKDKEIRTKTNMQRKKENVAKERKKIGLTDREKKSNKDTATGSKKERIATLTEKKTQGEKRIGWGRSKKKKKKMARQSKEATRLHLCVQSVSHLWAGRRTSLRMATCWCQNRLLLQRVAV